MFRVPVTPVTSEPYDLAIWTAKVPMPPEGAIDQHPLPGLDFSVVAKALSAVTAAIGAAAASSNERFAGLQGGPCRSGIDWMATDANASLIEQVNLVGVRFRGPMAC